MFLIIFNHNLCLCELILVIHIAPNMLKTHKKTIDKRNDGKMETNSHPQTNYLGSSGSVSPRAILQRPMAGSQVPYCPIEKKMSDSWSPLDPSTFKVDKKKECASNQAAYYPIGVDVFLSPHKIDHITRLLELPKVESSGKIRHLLVVNLQVYTFIPPTLFQNEYDGEGMSSVLYFKLSENYEELPLHFKENIRVRWSISHVSSSHRSSFHMKIIDDEVERVRGFPVDTIAPCRERLKIFGRLTNLEDLQLSSAERKLMSAYNEKPVLSRPQHDFFLVNIFIPL
ncbi:putative protein ENHANCED DISEASE RESISTANCE 2 [Helianthus anomalus]